MTERQLTPSIVAPDGEVREKQTHYSIMEKSSEDLPYEERCLLGLLRKNPWQGVRALAHYCRWSRDRLRRHLRHLESEGFLEVRKVVGKRTHYRTFSGLVSSPQWAQNEPTKGILRGLYSLNTESVSSQEDHLRKPIGSTEASDASFDESMRDAPPVRAPQPREPKNGPGGFVGWFKRRHFQLLGVCLDVAWKRDAIITASLLRSFPDDELKRRAEAFFKDDDAFRTKNGYTIPAFKQHVNAYAITLSASDRSKRDTLLAHPEDPVVIQWIKDHLDEAKRLGVA